MREGPTPAPLQRVCGPKELQELMQVLDPHFHAAQLYTELSAQGWRSGRGCRGCRQGAAPVRKVRMFSSERERQRQATVQARRPSAASASAAAMAERRTKRWVRSRMAGRA